MSGKEVISYKNVLFVGPHKLKRSVTKELQEQIDAGTLLVHAGWGVEHDVVGKVKTLRLHKNTNTLGMELDRHPGWKPSFNLERNTAYDAPHKWYVWIY